MTVSCASNQLISVEPDELQFQFELDKPSFCDLKVVNNTEHHVAFKVKTTSPKKYFVRPNTGVMQPWDSCLIRVTLQAQRDYPPDMNCKDKFLLQSTTVAPNIDVDDLPQDTFTKEGGWALEECKLRVVYISHGIVHDDEPLNSSVRSPTPSPDATTNLAVQRLKEERDIAIRQTQQLQQELKLLRRRKEGKADPEFSFSFAIVVGFIGLTAGFLFKLLFSSPTT